MNALGKFVPDVVHTKWIADRDAMELLADFSYIDPNGKVWLAPKGSVTDGASIPRLLWTVIGQPFDKDYRLAAVVHDVACVEKKSRWQDVHRMFYYACLCNGLARIKAKIMYYAVYKFGPRWGPGAPPKGVPMAPVSEEYIRREIKEMIDIIEREDPSLERLEQLAG